MSSEGSIGQVERRSLRSQLVTRQQVLSWKSNMTEIKEEDSMRRYDEEIEL